MAERPRPIVLKNLFGPQRDFDSLPWQPFREGVEIYRIYGDGQSGPSAALLRYEPGAGIPYHEHTGYEHILILCRSQSDHAGENDIGTLIVNPPGSGHSVHNKLGSIVLAIWESPIVLKPEPEPTPALEEA